MKMLIAALALGLIGSAAVAQTSSPPAPQVYSGCAKPAAPIRTVTATPSSLKATLAGAKPGDLILLESGVYGDLWLSAVNSDFITLAAAAGQTPLFTTIVVKGSHWRLSGLTVAGYPLATLSGVWQAHPAIVNAQGDNLIMDGNTVETVAGAYAWRTDDQGVSKPNPLASGITAPNVSCAAIEGNTISNVFNGIGVGGSQVGSVGKYILVARNRIDNFAGDGIDHTGSFELIDANVITNGHDICANLCIHNDGIQGWNYNDQPGLLNTDVTISNNLIIQQTTPAMVLPADDMHGITIFDGNWTRVHVVNNAIITPTWHGIALYGATASEVVNNTVAAPLPARLSWIDIENLKGATTSPNLGVIVRNNIAAQFVIGKGVAGVTSDHNLVVKTPATAFTAFNPATAQYDLHPLAASPARGAGLVDALTPTADIAGRARPTDAGAYAY